MWHPFEGKGVVANLVGNGGGHHAPIMAIASPLYGGLPDPVQPRDFLYSDSAPPAENARFLARIVEAKPIYDSHTLPASGACSALALTGRVEHRI
ncbi:MAG: hypothetical protein AAFQ85_04365 [Pseudomonadota bacterium]